jgi:hypothetical protein
MNEIARILDRASTFPLAISSIAIVRFVVCVLVARGTCFVTVDNAELCPVSPGIGTRSGVSRLSWASMLLHLEGG